ncbi:hypothetical protein [Cupriavidus necator]
MQANQKIVIIGGTGLISSKTTGRQRAAADDVATFHAELAVAAPVNGIVEIAGPERQPFDDIVSCHMAMSGDTRRVARDPEAKYFGGTVGEMSLVPLGDARLGTTTHATWYQCQQPV